MVGTELIRDYVNTRDLLEEGEALGTAAELASWLVEHDLTPNGTSATGADLRRAKELREALRQLLLANTGLEVDTVGAFAVLDGAAQRARIRLRFEEGRAQLEPSVGGVTGALGRILIGVHTAMGDGSWERLKACRASDCEWAFIDVAKNQSRAWCSMRVCGNREKARLFRERQRTRASSSSK